MRNEIIISKISSPRKLKSILIKPNDDLVLMVDQGTRSTIRMVLVLMDKAQDGPVTEWKQVSAVTTKIIRENSTTTLNLQSFDVKIRKGDLMMATPSVACCLECQKTFNFRNFSSLLGNTTFWHEGSK